MIRRLIVFVSVFLLAVAPLATAYAIPHDHAPAAAPLENAPAAAPLENAPAAVPLENALDQVEADCEEPGCAEQMRRWVHEDGQCHTMTGHCSGSMFRPDLADVMAVDWSLNTLVPASDTLIRELNPESETPPPRS